jgi:hypothetical protein
VLLFSVAANTEWSDFPVKGLFVPLLHRSLAYLAREPFTEQSLLVGEEATRHLRTSGTGKLIITKPGNVQIFLTSQQEGAEKTIRFSDDDSPGIYAVSSEHDIIDKFAVNMDPDESNTIPSDENHRSALLKRLGIEERTVHFVSQPQEAQRLIRESRLGAELWKQFLIAALVIALIEMFVARENNRFLSLDTHHGT